MTLLDVYVPECDVELQPDGTLLVTHWWSHRQDVAATPRAAALLGTVFGVAHSLRS